MDDWVRMRVSDSYEFPTDLPDDPDGARGALRWASAVIAGTAALLALLNAQAIRGWTEELPPGPRTVTLVAAASGWEDVTAQLELGAGRARLHKAWRGIEEAQWTPQAAETQEARR